MLNIRLYGDNVCNFNVTISCDEKNHGLWFVVYGTVLQLQFPHSDLRPLSWIKLMRGLEIVYISTPLIKLWNKQGLCSPPSSSRLGTCDRIWNPPHNVLVLQALHLTLDSLGFPSLTNNLPSLQFYMLFLSWWFGFSL